MAALPPEVIVDLERENTRLQAELRTARDRQTASAEILRTIGNASGDAEASLGRIAETTKQLFEASSVSIFVAEGDRWAQIIHDGASSQRIGTEVPVAQLRVGGHSLPGATFSENRQIHVPDIDNVDSAIADWPGLRPARSAGTRTLSGTPLRRMGQPIGVLIVHRDRLAPFTTEELALLQSFADQAVIAIENARLFNETGEALARQTATSEILRVISQSPTDVKPVFDAIVLASVRLLGCDRAFFLRCDGATYSREAIATPEGLLAERGSDRAPIDPDANFPSRAMVEKKTLHLPDWSLIDLPEHERLIHEKHSINSALYLPLLREGECIYLLVWGGKRPGMFGESEIALAESFRDQALIAIENVRLFNETREALERQTATADILKVIASSPSDVQPVFEAIVASADKLIGGFSTGVYRFADDIIHLAAFTPVNPASDAMLKARFPRPLAGAEHFRMAHAGEVSVVADTEAQPNEPLMELARVRGFRSLLYSPLMSKGKSIGVIAVSRRNAGPFSAHHVQLLQTFADQAVIAIENVRLFNETREALERQTATADILKVIASSPSDVQPVFEAIATSANRLIRGFSSTVFRFIDGVAHLKAFTPTTPAADEVLQATFPRPVADFPPFQMAQAGKVTQIPDTEAFSDDLLTIARARGFRSMLFAPLMNEGASIGFIAVTRVQPGSFADHHVQLLQTFADQAVIAIENARLFEEVQAKTRDLTEALTYQTGSSNILKVIASSPTDVQPVLEAIVESACELCEAYDAVVRLKEGDDLCVRAHYGPIPVDNEKWPISRNWTAGRAVIDRQPVHAHDLLSPEGDEFPEAQALARQQGHRTILSVPLLLEGASIGAIVLRRTEVNPFSDKQIALLQTFADQAVIAIENVRLFNETREALERQTATSEVLRVISNSPGDLEPVFRSMLENAVRICEAKFGTLFLADDGALRPAALHNLPSELADFVREQRGKFLPLAGSAIDRIWRTREVINNPDDAAEPVPSYAARLGGARSYMAVPMLKEGELIGVFGIYRQEVRPFTDRQVELVANFANQAVIAIENTRLLKELRQRTDDLSESLQQQTATADVLKVISRSAFDLQTVLDTLVESAARLCDADRACVFQKSGELFHWVSNYGFSEELIAYANTHPFAAGTHSTTSRVALEGKAIHNPDVLADPNYKASEYQRLGNYRTMLGIPLLREGAPIGVFILAREQVRPFSDRQIDLVTTFADQAVIAIENVRLFDEVQARTRDLSESLQQQTATADVLKVISRSAFDLQTVLDTLVESAARLCEADMAAITRQKGDEYFRAGSYGFTSEFMEYVQDIPVKPERATITGRTLLEGKVTHVPDVHADPDYTFSEAQRLSGDPRTFLGVPLLREGHPVGALVLLRRSMRPFTDKQIELVTTFADQAAIAIENVRLFDEVQTRTKELAASLEDLRTAQDRLVQTEKLASLGQLTAGIAHEIKNPLNFVNNFAALSAELTDELNGVLKPAMLTDKIRAEVDELTGLLKDNLEKVVQHGKRADSIVKNMLLHSREGSGEHRPADINALLDESLNLAYHGARAERPQFNVTLQRDFDDKAGMIELFPQEITRVFLNLISNGFYAVTKRKTENGSSGFEPVVSATTRDLGSTVEIRIRDNGTGIPTEVREKMFNPFFTTKPAGEGTGLGLSMSHDIIVKQHGGSIDVETEPGQFTEFRIILPRTGNSSSKIRGQT